MRRAITLFAASLLLLNGCRAPEDGVENSPTPPTPVRELSVRKLELVSPIFGTGTIAAHKTTAIGPSVDGIIEEIYVKVGDRVEAGDPLFRTRPVHYEIRAEEAAQALKLAQAELEHARREKERIQKLRGSSISSQDQLDAVVAQYDIALARLGQARAAEARAKQNLEDTVVRAPYAAAITQRYVDEGAMMRTMLSANSPVVQIMKMDIVAAIVQVPEVHLSEVRVGTPAKVQVDGMDLEMESEVYILNDRVDHVSRAFEVRLPLSNADYAIKPGLFVQAHLLPESRSVLVVDREAVLGSKGNRYVFVHNDGEAKRLPIEVRDVDASQVEVTAGLVEGDRVLAGPNLRRLSSGAPILVEDDHAHR